jgi:hypothetical protein
VTLGLITVVPKRRACWRMLSMSRWAHDPVRVLGKFSTSVVHQLTTGSPAGRSRHPLSGWAGAYRRGQPRRTGSDDDNVVELMRVQPVIPRLYAATRYTLCV